MFNIFDGRSCFWQWDLDQKLIVNVPSCTEVHFEDKNSDTALVCEVYELDGKRVVNVPNCTLQTAGTLIAYIVFDTSTIRTCRFVVNPRQKPADYIYTETEVRNFYALEARIKALEEACDTGSIPRVESIDENNLKTLRDLDSGVYILYGYFHPFSGSPDALTYENALVSVAKREGGSHVLVISPLNFKIFCEEILVDESNQYGFTYTREIISPLELNERLSQVGSVEELETEAKDSIVAAINEVNADIGNIETALDSIIAIQKNLVGGAK